MPHSRPGSRPGSRPDALLLPAFLLAAALLLPVAALARPSGNPPAESPANLSQTGASQEDAGPGILSLLPEDSVTHHEIATGGKGLAYTATAGTLALRDRHGRRTAAIYYTAYALDGAAAETRPVTFVFNGGPGAASAYLHLGLVGPRIAAFGPRRQAAPAQLQPNPDSWLQFTDLVLIDPVGTGWSRSADPDEAERFWGVEPDARALAKAIALYVADNGRTASPKVLLGESYGGFRAAKVAQALQQDQGIIVTGLVMVSPFLDGALHFGADRLALNAALLLPSIAATQLDRQDRFTDQALAAAERFAMTDYLVTLAGPPPGPDSAGGLYARVAELTGLPLDVVTRTRGFVAEAYLEHPRDGAAEVASPYDATFLLADPFPESDDRGGDPILDGYLQSLGGLFVGYARQQLGFATAMTYELLNRRVSGRWDWHGHGQRGASAVAELHELLTLNPGLGLLIAHGRSDLVTPYGISRYILDHLPPQVGADRARLEIYEGGHMFYFDPAVRAAFTAEAAAFYRATAP